jgi:dephospho-CoA kinase
MAIMIGLTGGIGAGKTTIAKVFATLGIPVFNADDMAKELMQTSPELQQKLVQQFGEKLYQDGKLDRAYLAGIVFKDAFQLATLNAIVHPITIQAAKDWALKQNTPYVIKEAALIFESAAADGLSGVIGVTAPLAVRTLRVMKRENCTREMVIQRMQHQISESLKMKLCDWVIVNDDQHLVVPQVVALHKTILSQFCSTSV